MRSGRADCEGAVCAPGALQRRTLSAPCSTLQAQHVHSNTHPAGRAAQAPLHVTAGPYCRTKAEGKTTQRGRGTLVQTAVGGSGGRGEGALRGWARALGAGAVLRQKLWLVLRDHLTELRKRELPVPIRVIPGPRSSLSLPNAALPTPSLSFTA